MDVLFRQMLAGLLRKLVFSMFSLYS